ncbi:MAG: LCP family protein [Actinomycetota bacterium]|nr:LCP family protein [Actinomycetota bacterium]
MARRMGPRRAALQRRRAEQRKRTLSFAGVTTTIAVVLAIVGAALFAREQIRDDRADVPMPAPSERDSVTTLLAFGTREQDDDSAALWMNLIAYDREQDRAAVIYIPAHAAVEVPGRGLQGAGDALASGGIPLLLVSTENMLGIEIDAYLELSDNDAELLFGAVGPVSVDVPEDVRVSVGGRRSRVIFVSGLQEIEPDQLVRLLYTRGQDSDDVELGLRHIAFWDSLFDAFEDAPDNLAAAVRASGGALAESDMEPEEHARLLSTIASLDQTARTISTLPVSQVSVGGSELYAVNRDEVVAFLSETLDVATRSADDIRVQVLNGNGVPGIGQEVAERLVGQGFRVVLTSNARRLDYERTLVITYDDSEEGLAAAERARRLLGVGEVQVSVQEQGIVDLTIVVGRDFLRTS